MRLYYGTYGHRLSGKLYVYWGDDNLRTGQQVTAPVTSKRSGKTYNTMFTIARAQSQSNAQGEVNRLNGEGIFIKTIGGRDVLSLPGGKPFSSKAEWKRDSDRRYRRRFGLSEPEPKVRAKRKTNGTPSRWKKQGSKKNSKQNSKTIKVGEHLKKIGEGFKDAKSYDSAYSEIKASISKNKTAADSFQQKEQIKKMKQREAFTED